jgi:MtN3 and saliva related transmembrane protein
MIDLILLLGLAAATLTTIAFVPQVIRTARLKETKDISLLMYVIFCIGVALWLMYGIVRNDLPMMFANFVTLILASIVLSFKLRYG